MFSDAIRVHDIYDDAASIQAQANSAAMSFQFNKDQYDKSVNESNFVAEMRKYGLDVATTQIHNSKNQSQVWDESGMTFRMWNDERNDFDPEQIKIINNMMVFTDSGFDDTKMAIGKISLSNGTTAYGINAEVFVGTAIFSQYFTAQNPSGTFKIDDSGLSATNGINTIKIQPNNSGELFSIYKGNSKQLYFTSDGDAVFSGSLKSASGTFSGLISGGSINLGNGTFTVDSNGNMYASSGSFGGNLSAAGGTFTGTLSGVDGTFTGTLYGNEIVGANGEFTKGFNVNVPIGSKKNAIFQLIDEKGIKVGYTYNNNNFAGIEITSSSISITSPPSGIININDVVRMFSIDGMNIKELVVKSLKTTDIGNVHFNKTPYIDSYGSYLAREEWCNNNFAPKEHSHSKYTTENEVKTIIKQMVKSSALK